MLRCPYFKVPCFRSRVFQSRFFQSRVFSVPVMSRISWRLVTSIFDLFSSDVTVTVKATLRTIPINFECVFSACKSIQTSRTLVVVCVVFFGGNRLCLLLTGSWRWLVRHVLRYGALKDVWRVGDFKGAGGQPWVAEPMIRRSPLIRQMTRRPPIMRPASRCPGGRSASHGTRPHLVQLAAVNIYHVDTCLNSRLIDQLWPSSIASTSQVVVRKIVSKLLLEDEVTYGLWRNSCETYSLTILFLLLLDWDFIIFPYCSFKHWWRRELGHA